MGTSASLMTIEGNPELSKEIQDEYERLVQSAQDDNQDVFKEIEDTLRGKFEAKVEEWRARWDFLRKLGVEDSSNEEMKNYILDKYSKLKKKNIYTYDITYIWAYVVWVHGSRGPKLRWRMKNEG